MRRAPALAPFLAMLVVMLLAGCVKSRPPVPVISSVATAEPCAAEVDGANVKDWKQVRADAFSFCVPKSWTLDERYQRTTARLRRTGFASFSWAAPDTLQRVIIEVPFRDFTRKDLKNSLELCLERGVPGRDVHEIQGQNVCGGLRGKGFSSGASLLYREPFVRVTAIGMEDAIAVAQTLRPIRSSP
jgi:hypothetical protein